MDELNQLEGKGARVYLDMVSLFYERVCIKLPIWAPPIMYHTQHMWTYIHKKANTHTHTQSEFVNAKFQNWMVDGMLAGEVKSGGGLTFLEVENAGHMVPADQPKAVS